MKTSNPGDYQIIHSSGVELLQALCRWRLGSEINEANIPNLKLVMTAMIEPFRKITPKLSGAPYDYGTTGIAYNTKVISEARGQGEGRQSADRPQVQGQDRRLWRHGNPGLVRRACSPGQNPNDIKDIDAVWAKVRESRDLAKKYWGSGAELMDLLSKEEIVVTDAWSGRIAALQQQGHPIGYLDPPAAYAWMEDMLVLKGSPMAECEELINFMLDPADADRGRRRAELSALPRSDQGQAHRQDRRRCRPSIRPAR